MYQHTQTYLYMYIHMKAYVCICIKISVNVTRLLYRVAVCVYIVCKLPTYSPQPRPGGGRTKPRVRAGLHKKWVCGFGSSRPSGFNHYIEEAPKRTRQDRRSSTSAARRRTRGCCMRPSSACLAWLRLFTGKWRPGGEGF